MWLTRARAVSLCALLAWALAVPALRAQELPTPDGKVNDFAELLDESQRQKLEDQLAALERDTSAEVALVTMRTIGSQSIEDYATRLFNAWGIGKKRHNNGLLVLVVMQDRAMRIEVGYGLEGILPDGLAGAVMRETFLPRFRTDDNAAGVLEGMTRLIEIVRRNETLTAEQRAALTRDAVEAGKSWDMVWLFAAFASAGAFALGLAAGAKVIVQLLFGLCFTGGALYFSTFIVPRTAVWSLSLLAAGVAVLGFVLGAAAEVAADSFAAPAAPPPVGWPTGAAIPRPRPRAAPAPAARTASVAAAPVAAAPPDTGSRASRSATAARLAVWRPSRSGRARCISQDAVHRALPRSRSSFRLCVALSEGGFSERRTPRPTSGQARPRRRSCRASSTTCTAGSGGNPPASPPRSPDGRAA